VCAFLNCLKTMRPVWLRCICAAVFALRWCSLRVLSRNLNHGCLVPVLHWHHPSQPIRLTHDTTDPNRRSHPRCGLFPLAQRRATRGSGSRALACGTGGTDASGGDAKAQSATQKGGCETARRQSGSRDQGRGRGETRRPRSQAEKAPRAQSRSQGGVRQRRLTPPAAARHKGQAFKQRHVLFILQKRAVQFR